MTRTMEESLDIIATAIEQAASDRETIREGRQPKISPDGKTYRYPLASGGYVIERLRDGKLHLIYEDADGQQTPLASKSL